MAGYLAGHFATVMWLFYIRFAHLRTLKVIMALLASLVWRSASQDEAIKAIIVACLQYTIG